MHLYAVKMFKVIHTYFSKLLIQNGILMTSIKSNLLSTRIHITTYIYLQIIVIQLSRFKVRY